MNREYVPSPGRPLAEMPSVIRRGGIDRLRFVVQSLLYAETSAELAEWGARLRDSLSNLHSIRSELPLEHDEAQDILQCALAVKRFKPELYTQLRALFRQVIDLCSEEESVSNARKSEIEALCTLQGVQRLHRRRGVQLLHSLAEGRSHWPANDILKEALKQIATVPMSQAPDPSELLMAQQAIRKLFVKHPEFCESNAEMLLTIQARLEAPVKAVADLEKHTEGKF